MEILVPGESPNFSRVSTASLELTVFENHPNCRIGVFQVWHFPPFLSNQVTCLVTLFDRKLSLAMLNETFSVIFKHRVGAKGVS